MFPYMALKSWKEKSGFGNNEIYENAWTFAIYAHGGLWSIPVSASMFTVLGVGVSY